MDWNEEVLESLRRLFSEKSWALIKPVLDSQGEDAAQEAWDEYLASHGFGVLSANSDYDPLVPRAVVGADGVATVRLLNTWGDKYIDIPEDFALKVLALGSMP